MTSSTSTREFKEHLGFTSLTEIHHIFNKVLYDSQFCTPLDGKIESKLNILSKHMHIDISVVHSGQLMKCFVCVITTGQTGRNLDHILYKYRHIPMVQPSQCKGPAYPLLNQTVAMD